jgi:PAS domain S-box-containing protein
VNAEVAERSDHGGQTAAARRWTAVVASSDDAILTKSSEGVITGWNAAAAELYGYAADEAVGRSIAMLIPPERAGEELRLLERVMRGERVRHYETVRVRKDGRPVEVSLSISPVRGADGAIEEVSVWSRARSPGSVAPSGNGHDCRP